jgi:hypothetical protein
MSSNDDGSKHILSRWWFWTFIAFPGAVLSVFLGSLLAHFTVGRIDDRRLQHKTDTVKVIEHPVGKMNIEEEKPAEKKAEKHQESTNPDESSKNE